MARSPARGPAAAISASSSTAARRMPAAIPKTAATRLLAAADLALRLDGSKRDGPQRQSRRGSRAAARAMSFPTSPCCASTCGRGRPTIEAEAKRAIDEARRRGRRRARREIEVNGGFGRPPKPLTAEAEALFDLVKQAGADLGQDIAWQPSGGVCDGNNIAACGVPVVDTMGVRGGKIHSMEEFLIVDSLAERAALVRADHPAAGRGGRMSFRVRPATGEDFRAIYQMAKLTGGGFTNLPADRGDAGRQARPIATRASRARRTRQAGDLYVFVLGRPEAEQDPRHLPGVRPGRRRPALLQLPPQHADPDQPGARQDFPQPDADADHRP